MAAWHTRSCVLLLWLALGACSREPAPEAPTPPAPEGAAEEAGKAAPAAAGPTLYTWYDAGGRPRLASSIDEIPEAARGSVVVSQVGGGAATALAREATVGDFRGDAPAFSRVDLTRLAEPGELDGAALLAHRRVYLYSTEWCGFCKKLKAYLDERHVAYEERDIEKSRRAASELAAKQQAAGVKAGGVPVLDVHGTVIVGFDRTRVDAALEAAGYGKGEAADGTPP